MSKKFWSVVNLANSEAEIKLYGPIASGHSWFDNGDEVTANDFIKDLESLGGKDLTVRINSPGGDVFAAHTIHNQLLAYKGNVTVIIDGLCASAATIVAVAGKKIIMPSNALFMIHNPAIGLDDYYGAEELNKVLNALKGVKDSIIAAYRKRCKVSDVEISQMMDAETWMGAQECLDKGFIDEIAGTVKAVRNGNSLIINSLTVDLSGYKNLASIKNHVKEADNMPDKVNTFFDEAINFFKNFSKPAANNQQAASAAPVAQNVPEDTAAMAVAAERKRVTDLEAYDTKDNAVLAAMIAQAKQNGQTIDEIKPYLDTVEQNSGNGKAKDFVKNMIQDNKESGVEGVGSVPKDDGSQGAEADAKAMAAFVDAMDKLGGKK